MVPQDYFLLPVLISESRKEDISQLLSIGTEGRREGGKEGRESVVTRNVQGWSDGDALGRRSGVEGAME